MQQQLLQSSLFQKPTLENSVWYGGHRFSFLATGEQTGGSFSLIYCFFRKGGEPPAHFHQHEDETFYILEGEIMFRIGDKKFTATKGEFVYEPKEIPHQFSLVTETAKALLLITPAGFETFFKEFSVRAHSLDLPPLPGEQPSAEFFEKMNQRAVEFGLVWVPEF